jgi:hydrogenase nickel incorporation protein HypB
MFFQSKRVLAINVLSFSSSSARPLLRQTVAEWGRHRHVAVVDSVFLESIHAAHDHESSHCHAHDEAGEDLGLLDAHKISHALHALDLDGVDVLLLENGGSAACQALNDLGEVLRVAVFSVRDGELKPLKFPPFFQKADAVVIQDMDQADALGFDLSKARANVRSVAPQAALLEASARTGTGLGEWYAFLEAGLKRFEA